MSHDVNLVNEMDETLRPLDPNAEVDVEDDMLDAKVHTAGQFYDEDLIPDAYGIRRPPQTITPPPPASEPNEEENGLPVNELPLATDDVDVYDEVDRELSIYDSRTFEIPVEDPIARKHRLAAQRDRRQMDLEEMRMLRRKPVAKTDSKTIPKKIGSRNHGRKPCGRRTTRRERRRFAEACRERFS